MASTHDDVAALGAGPGGYVGAIRAAQLGAKVAIVEKQYLGGTCLNVGCIPSKAMLHIAETLHNMESLSELGINLPQPPTFDMRKAVAFKDKVVKRMTGGVGTLMKGNNSDTCWDLPDTPKSIICVGGGVIGMELACMFNAMGSQVTVVEMLPNVLAPVDEEVRKLLVRILSKRGINIVTGAKVESITDEGAMKKVVASTAKGEQSFNGEYVLMAVSRRANTSGLEHLMEEGLDNDRGRVRVNEKMETNLPGIYAIGDLIHGAGLAHVASMEGEVAADNAMGHEAK